MVKGGICGKGGSTHGKGRGYAWQERWPLQWAVGILLECILVLHVLLSLGVVGPLLFKFNMFK